MRVAPAGQDVTESTRVPELRGTLFEERIAEAPLVYSVTFDGATILSLFSVLCVFILYFLCLLFRYSTLYHNDI